MIADELRGRTRQFALDVIALCLTVGSNDVARTIKAQLVRSATGVASNYRAACRSRSAREFASRLAVVVVEADESELWLDLLEANRFGPAPGVGRLRQEAVELRAILARSRSTTLDRLRAATRRPPTRKSPSAQSQ
jgi:four helix bundle protein